MAARSVTTMTHVHHAIDYIELMVTDLEAAKGFYATAFGWSFNDYGPDYAGIRSPDGEGEVGGLNPARAPRPGGPLVILYSDDLDATVSTVRVRGRPGDRGSLRVPGRAAVPLHRPQRQRAGSLGVIVTSP